MPKVACKSIKSKMKTDKVLIIVVVVSFLILGGGIFLVSRMEGSPEITASQNAKVQVEETEHDWGEIKLKGGDVKKTFTIKNGGTGNLQLANIKTSCMCTTAQVKINRESSPFFGMHSRSSWIGEVVPGEKAELEVVFDPDYHGPSGIGPVTREIVVETNDPENRIITFNLNADVTN